MTTFLVWLLITTSYGTYNRGNVSTVAWFITKEDCMHILQNLPGKDMVQSSCIQAREVNKGLT